MKYYGLLGGKLGHSYSPQIHHTLGILDYRLFEVPESDGNALDLFLQRDEIQGLNVTIPYKKSVMQYCHDFDSTAQKIACVNTMLRQADGTWKGYNTDYYGFVYLLERSGIQPKAKKVLVLGSGGASLTVCAALRDLQAKEVVSVSRKGSNTYENLHKHADARIVINTTPVGMYPDNQGSLLSLESFPLCEGVIDLIYNPLRTNLILEAQQRDIPAMGGLAMLVAQAKQASELFQGKSLDTALLERLTNQMEKSMTNIVLIGMPGCGKTSLGKKVAETLERPFIDIDYEIERRFKASPSAIIQQQGEAAFRTYEHAIITEFGKQSGMVLSTGGGAVTKQENYGPLAQQGKIFWIQRDMAHLPDKDRILSQQYGVATLYEQRKALYEMFADCVIENINFEKTVSHICKVFEL